MYYIYNNLKEVTVEDLLKNISQYQLFNFLLTGTFLALAISSTTSIDLLSDNLLFSLVGYYFLGLVVSRFGSLIIGNIYKKLKIVKYRTYDRYLAAAMHDPKIEILVQDSNLYRTFIAASFLYLIVLIVDKFYIQYIRIYTFETYAIFALIGILIFSFAYRRQVSFITKRIDKHGKN